ncbi:response regulator [Bradyrhizobium sp. HKCCYLS3077]|uniref:response regulator n=1 Tax=Bradyrhizobium sp. HKCCYLS3077 TaxID=3420761 RepID=UPI003EC13A33
MNEFTVLIVEDTPHYQAIYSRAVKRRGGVPLVADTLEKAISAISRQQFCVSLIDIRLDEVDDKNEDGLTVLQHIREVGDPTEAIVVTGHGSMKIGWEAHLNSAFATFAKRDMHYSELEDSISKALDSFKTKIRRTTVKYSELLRPPTEQVWEWEDRVLRACSPKGGADGLYKCLSDLLRDLTPLLKNIDRSGCTIVSHGIAAGIFWSRRIAAPILICFGRTTNYTPHDLINNLGFDSESLVSTRQIASSSLSGMSGTAHILEGLEFSQFEQLK